MGAGQRRSDPSVRPKGEQREERCGRPACESWSRWCGQTVDAVRNPGSNFCLMNDPTSSGPRDLPDAPVRQISDFRILRRLGRGGMAVVYLAEQLSLRRKVAVKVLRRDLARDATYVKRLHHEATAAASLIHANIVQIYEVGQINGVHYIAQEYVRGQNLGLWVRQKGPANAQQATAILKQVAAALVKAAEHNIVHRDIKPENIILSLRGEVKVADFGLAHKTGQGTGLTQTGMTMGTPLYMSPEQLEGRTLDARSDIYSLGATCYFLLVGQPPYAGDSAIAVAMQHLHQSAKRLESLRPDLPLTLCEIVHRMLEKDPAHRYQTPAELLEAVVAGEERASSDTGSGTTPASSSINPKKIPQNATERLGRVMQKEPDSAAGRRLAHGRLRWAVAGGLLLGIVLGIVRRTDRTRGGASEDAIPRRESAWAQLYHAKLSDSERAWKAVKTYYPDDQEAVQRSLQGLARHYVEHGEHRAAWQTFTLLARADTSPPDVRAFGLAGKAIVEELMGKSEEARATRALLTADMQDRLDPAMQRMLKRVMTRGEKDASP